MSTLVEKTVYFYPRTLTASKHVARLDSTLVLINAVGRIRMQEKPNLDVSSSIRGLSGYDYLQIPIDELW